MAEEHHQQRERRRRDQRRAGALHRASGDLDLGRAGNAGGQRARSEHGPADAEKSLGTEHVRQAAAEQQQAAEGDDVGVEHPREVLGTEAEVGADVGQRDSDDARVHDDHELCERDDG